MAKCDSSENQNPLLIAQKIVVGDYVGEATRCAEFGTNRFMGVFWGDVQTCEYHSFIAGCAPARC